MITEVGREPKRTVVTGASSGIGAALCRALAAQGFPVFAIARRREPLERLAAETGCAVLAADVTDMETLAPAIEAFDPDILINNAGTGHGISGLGDVDAALIAQSVATNVTALIQLTALVTERWKAEGRQGHVVNLGSISGLHTGVSALYGAGKAAVHLFSQNLRVELRGYPIRVTELCPGRVSTEFYGAAQGDRNKLDRMGKTEIAELSPDDIADAALFAINAPPHVNVSTIEILPVEQSVGGVTMTPISLS